MTELIRPSWQDAAERWKKAYEDVVIERDDAREALTEARGLADRLAAVVRCIDVSDDGNLDDEVIDALAAYDEARAFLAGQEQK